MVGIAHPSVGQSLQGRQSEARLPPVLIIVLLAAWGKALGLERASLVADIWSISCGIAWHTERSVKFSGCQRSTLGKV